MAEAMVRKPRPVEPVAPVAAGRGKTLVRFVDVGRRLQALRPGERAIDLLVGRHDVPGASPVALDSNRHVCLKADRDPCAAGVCGPPAPVDERPLGVGSTVVERWLADQFDLDLPFEAADGPDEHVVGVGVGGWTRVRGDRVLTLVRSHRERVPDHDPSGGRLPGGRHDVGAWLVVPGGRHVDAERAESKHAGPAIEQSAEHARRIEPRNAEPVDRPVGRDESARMAVRKKRVVGDRGKRGRGSGALWHRRDVARGGTLLQGLGRRSHLGAYPFRRRGSRQRAS